MKKIVLAAVMTAMSMSLFAINIFNYVPLADNVKSYTRTDYVISSKFGKYYQTPNTKIVHNFDDDQNEIEVTEFTARDVLLNRTVYEYDAEGNLLLEECKDANDVLLWKTVVTYEKGRKADSSEYGKNEVLRGKVIYSYPKKTDGVIEESGYDEEGNLVWKTVYKYEEDRLMTVSQYSYDGSLDQEEKYSYTEDGKMKSISTSDRENKGLILRNFIYDSEGFLKEITTYSENKEISERIRLKYNEDGNVESVTEYYITEKFGTKQTEPVGYYQFTYSDEVTETIQPAESNIIDAK